MSGKQRGAQGVETGFDAAVPHGGAEGDAEAAHEIRGHPVIRGDVAVLLFEFGGDAAALVAVNLNSTLDDRVALFKLKAQQPLIGGEDALVVPRLVLDD